MVPRDPNQLLSAPLPDRLIARCIDFWRSGVVLVLALLPAGCVEFYSQAVFRVGPSARGQLDFGKIDYGELAGLLAFAAAVSLSYEPLRMVRKGTTSGKAKRRMELRAFDQPALGSLTKRAIGRYFVSVGACGASTAVAVAVSAAAGAGPSLWTVIGLAAASSCVTWLSTLLTARLRVDRRGWHDVLAGTMLVTTRRYRPVPPIVASR